MLLAFLALSLVVICTPGPDTALTVRNALLGGRSGGAWTAAGVASGQAVWTVAASLGAASLLRASQPAFLALKLVGVAYLLYLGGHALWAAVKRRPAHATRPRTGTRPARWRAYRQGLVNDLANPRRSPGGPQDPRNDRDLGRSRRGFRRNFRCSRVVCGLVDP